MAKPEAKVPEKEVAPKKESFAAVNAKAMQKMMKKSPAKKK
jgi:hypothetical protein